MRRPSRTVLAMAVAVVLSLELGVVAAELRGTPVVVRAAAPAAPVELAVAPALSGAEAAEIGRPATPRPPVAAPVPAPEPKVAESRTRRTAPRVRRPAAKPAACPPTAAVPSTRATRARAIDGSVAIYNAPGAAKPARTMANPRPEDNMPLEFRVMTRRGEWLQVLLPVRPNGTRGWIKVSEVELSGLPYRILVERCAHRMTVFKDGVVVMREVVAVGKPGTPTPLVDTFVDYVYPYSMRSGYGPWLVSIAAFSEVLQEFGGGRGQLALHGTGATWSLGRDASHGCIRMRPDASTQLAKLVKPGTPVTIVP